MKYLFWLALLLILYPSVVSAADEDTKLNIISVENQSAAPEGLFGENYSSEIPVIYIPGVTRDQETENVSESEGIFQDPENKDKNYSSNFTAPDAYSDIAVDAWDKIMWNMGNQINGRFGGTVTFIFKFITWNIKPWEIAEIAEFEHQNWLLLFPLGILIIICVNLARVAATAGPTGYKTVFGNVDIVHNDFLGSGLFMGIALSSSVVAVLLLMGLDVINAYFMILVFDSIRPSVDTGVMYFMLALTWLLVFVFFFYRQVMIVILYAISPFYGLAFATGMFKEAVDDIGDKFIRALIMQPACIIVTVVSIKVMEASKILVFGVEIWEAGDQAMFYFALAMMLLLTCCYCTFGKATWVKRGISLIVTKKVL